MPTGDRLTGYGRPDETWALQSVTEDRTARPADFQGKTIVLNFRATWCGPCRWEMSSLQALHDSVDSTKVAVVLVSDEDSSTVRSYLTENDYEMPFSVAGTRPPQELETHVIPTTYVINAGAVLIYRHEDATDWNSPFVKEFIAKLSPDAPASTAVQAMYSDRQLSETVGFLPGRQRSNCSAAGDRVFSRYRRRIDLRGNRSD